MEENYIFAPSRLLIEVEHAIQQDKHTIRHIAARVQTTGWSGGAIDPPVKYEVPLKNNLSTFLWVGGGLYNNENNVYRLLYIYFLKCQLWCIVAYIILHVFNLWFIWLLRNSPLPNISTVVSMVWPLVRGGAAVTFLFRPSVDYQQRLYMHTNYLKKKEEREQSHTNTPYTGVCREPLRPWYGLHIDHNYKLWFIFTESLVFIGQGWEKSWENNVWVCPWCLSTQVQLPEGKWHICCS